MLDAVREPGVHLLAAEMKVGLARMAHRPAADPLVEIEQAGLVRDFRARPRRHEATRGRGGNRRLLVARTLAEKPARPDRNDPRLLRPRWRGLRSRSACGCLVGGDGAAATGRAGAGAAGRGGGAARGASTTGFAATSGFSLGFTGEGRAFRPSRCALPITALRLTPPRSSAIWLAVAPPSHILVNFAIRSSVQLMLAPNSIHALQGLGPAQRSIRQLATPPCRR